MLLRLFLLSTIGAGLLAVQSQNSQSWLSPSATSYLAPAKSVSISDTALNEGALKVPGDKGKVHLIHLNESKVLNKDIKAVPSQSPKKTVNSAKPSTKKNSNLTKQAHVAPSYLPPNHRAKTRRNALQKLAPTRAEKRRLVKKRAKRLRRAKLRAKAKRLAALKRKRARARARARRNAKRYYYYPRQRIIYWY